MGSQFQTQTFALSDLEPATNLLEEVDYHAAVEIRLLNRFGNQSGRIVGSSKRDRTIVACRNHAFLSAVHEAFNEHRPLVISPDHIWLLICQGFALHVQENAEALRHHFVTHTEKKLIEIVEPADLQWEKVVSTFSQAVRENLVTDLYTILTPHFSTTTPIEATAFEISLLDTVKEYFAYWMTLCGIPSITLEGSPEDWRTLQKHLRQLSVFDLDWWVKQVDPIIDEFIATAEGHFNKSFWEDLYKYQSRSGHSPIDGWLVRFFPYARYKYWEEMFGKKPATWEYKINPYFDDSLPYGLGFEDVPGGYVRTPFTWDRGDSRSQMNFISGFIGIRQNPETKALRPEIGWAVQWVSDVET
jgi:hypothetical protein